MTYTPLAVAADLTTFGSFSTLTRDFAAPAIDALMIRASRAVEARCDRRLAPFTIVESRRADGIDIAGSISPGMPMDLPGVLGRSQAKAFGANSSVRDVWLREYAPTLPDLWTYANISIHMIRPYGGAADVLGAALEGPEPDTGHLRMRLGTYVPSGTTLRITYSGGYSTIPEDLNLATVMTAAKFAILSAEPQMRTGMDTVELDAEILGLLVPFIRS
jgi:hypothetical protein